MKLVGKTPSEEFAKHYRGLDRETARTCWENFSKAVASGSDGNAELRRCLQGMILLKLIKNTLIYIIKS